MMLDGQPEICRIFLGDFTVTAAPCYARTMHYRFDDYEVDGARFELRHGGTAVPVEPQVLAVLLVLLAHRDVLVTRDDLVAQVWQGRIVSDSAIDSRIKAARMAIGDDGVSQRLIRTVHGKGFRFIGNVEADSVAAATVSTEPVTSPSDPDRPSIAVLPFELLGEPGDHAVMADALPHELIAELSRLRWLFIIARGSSFRFRGDTPDIAAIGRALSVHYVLTGTIETSGRRITIAVELADSRDCGVIWSERFVAAPEEIHEVRKQIVARVIAALEIQIPQHAARAARLSAPDHLDAWSSYHLGLQHMYRFTRADNAIALDLFQRTVAREPEFSRAHAGLSFVQFQSAFLGYNTDRAADVAAARRAAEAAVAIDALDPFANMTLGRAHWLTGDLESSLGWLDRAIDLNPNYAQGIYSRAWAQTLLGQGDPGQRDADTAMALSPIDPLHYAMLGTRALAHMVRGQDSEAALWGDRAAHAPGAHVLIAVIAAACTGLVGDMVRAHEWAAEIRRRNPAFVQADFFRAFPFHNSAVRARIAMGLAQIGL